MVDTTLYRLFSSQTLSVSHGPTLHKLFPCAMLTQTDPDNIVDFFCAKLFVGYGPTLYRLFSCAMLAQADQDNIAYGYFPTKR